ncbi:MAG TPA: hypothetical protein VJV23_00205 [Candidatus Polarisedimenticolia bacterium]|nr:hypothetical protein [Candidatus Polarisedimenticolia bacterium]
MPDNRVVIVKETKIIEKDGGKVEVVVVQDEKGKAEEIEVVREDTAENTKDLEGSVLPDDDKSTPATEKEEDVEEDEPGKD